ncbi:MAG: DUF5719 family protein [Dermatophilaceae bacterium]
MRPLWAGATRVVVVAAAVGAALTAAYLPTSTLRPSAGVPGATATPSSAPVSFTELACPGPQTAGLAGVAEVAGTTAILAAAPPTGLAGPSGSGAIVGSALPGNRPLFTSPDPGVVSRAQLSGPSAALVSGRGALAPGLVASQLWSAETGDTRALVATPCLTPKAEHWLVGGGAQAARRERLVLTNVGANPVTATVTVLGTTGTLPAIGTNTVSVPPMSRSALLLDAIAPQDASPVVHVVATGGRLAAVLDDAWIDGATGRGADDAVSLTEPATRVIFPLGLARATRLRVAVPGPGDAQVTTTLLTPSGRKSPVSNGVSTVAHGTSADIDLTAVTEPVFAVELSSTAPIVAGALVQRYAVIPAGGSIVDAQSDLAWVPAMPPVGALAGAALAPAEVPSDQVATLFLASPDGASVSVTTIAAGQAVRVSVDIPPGGVTTVDVSTTSQVWVSGGGKSVFAAVLLGRKGADPPLLAVLPLPGLTLVADALVVRDVG